MEAPVPGAPSAQAPADRSGCARKALAGCGIAGLLLLVVVVGFFLYVRRNPALLTDLMMKQLESGYAPDVTEQDKTDLRSAYRDFRAASTNGRVQKSAASRMQITLSSNGSSQFDHRRVQELARAFREAAASSVPGSLSEPSPGPTP